jgi:hypothetical protein
VRVRYGEGLAIHSGPESCAVIRESVSEALTGVCIGQPLSRESFFHSGADIVTKMESNTARGANASTWTTRRGQRPWHVRTLLAREPGDLGFGRRGSVETGPAASGSSRPRLDALG